tara:strand:+ start:301 stop:519 length:219 start_codon:yes stop_codon:yes gene_type:complete
MRDIDTLNALTSPIGYDEQVLINDEVYKVKQTMNGQWFLRTRIDIGFNDICHNSSQVDFIANIVCYRDLAEA